MTEKQLRQQIVSKAESYIGAKKGSAKHKEIVDIYNSHKPLARGYALKYTDDWCSGFVSAMSIACGMTDIIPTEVGCSKHIDLFKKINSWQENDAYTPKVGDIMFYDWDDSGYGDNVGSADHVGIVAKVVGNNITVVEGNMGSNSVVGYRTMLVNGKYIRGYGIPNYASKATPEKTIDQLAQEVLAGKWGVGADRRMRLEAAGYDYNAVQARVNEILAKPAKSVDELAREVLDGKWGNGAERRKRLEAEGYDYDAVQKRVNEIVNAKSVDDLAREVIAGKWGVGADRRKRLEAAGYDYNAVQKRVNEILD